MGETFGQPSHRKVNLGCGVCFALSYRAKKLDREVETLVRESFWNVYKPGCIEHYVIHVLRDDPAFIPELDVLNCDISEIVEAVPDDGKPTKDISDLINNR